MKLFLATANAHKVRELRELLADSSLASHIASGLEIESAAALGGMPPVVEDTGTFVGNARKKAAALAALLPPPLSHGAADAQAALPADDCWALADDSGLCVDFLGGAPGVESAYFAGPEGDAAANLAKLVEVMRGVPAAQRGAHYVCVLVLRAAGGREHVFRGECYGTLAHAPRGQGGFGYDPLFIPHGSDRTFGELPAAVKQAQSHRAAASRLLFRHIVASGH